VAELSTADRLTGFLPQPVTAPPEAVPQPTGAGPLWRSLLFPLRGQRAVMLGRGDSDLFASLREAGVRFESGPTNTTPGRPADFNLILEDRTHAGSRVPANRISSLLAPGGRWVVALERRPAVGFAGWSLVRRAWRAGFSRVDTFYAHPSLRSPRILVPLDRPEAFRYFLDLAVGDRATRHRVAVLCARFLCALRLHRMMLPNVIVVARRKG
jgi:hypothetical protein